LRPFQHRTASCVAAAFLLLAGAQGHAEMILDPYRTGAVYDQFPPNGVGDSAFLGPVRVSANARGILLFDFASLSGPVTNATLALQVSDMAWQSVSPRIFDVYGRGGDGGVDGTDYELMQNSSAGSFAFESSDRYSPITVDITSFLNTFLDTPDYLRCQGISNPGTCYLMLQVAWPTPHGLNEPDHVTFHHAQLEITPVPLPSTLLLLMTGLGALGLLGSARASTASFARSA